jgi:glycosyltransferase involved in cell wall biosynthesis
MNMRLLLITPYFFPDEPVGAARWNRLVKYLVQNGFEVYVIASNLLTDSEESPLCKRLVRVSYQSSKIDQMLMRASGAKKELVIEKKRQSDDARPKGVATRIYSKLIEAVGRLVRFPAAYWWSAEGLAKEGIKIVREEKVDVIVATHPFSITLKAAYQISKLTNVPWIADMRDGWSSYYYGEYKYGTIYYKLLCVIERHYLKHAFKVVTINESLAKTIFVPDKKIQILQNVFDPEKIEVHDQIRQKRPVIDLAFAGSVHKNHCWDLFFEAILDFPNVIKNGNIRLNYYGGSYSVVAEKMNDWGIPDQMVQNHGYLDKNELVGRLKNADVLLVFGFSGAFGDTVTTGKIFDYIEIGKPIVVIGPSTSELSKMVLRTGIGTVLPDVGSVKEFIQEIQADMNRFAQKQRASVNRKELEGYSAKKVAEEYIKLLQQAMMQNK